MIKNIIFRNFLSFKDKTCLDFSENQKTMIVGPNASGKSNIIKAAEMFCYLVTNNNYIRVLNYLDEFKHNIYDNDVYSELQCDVIIKGNTYGIYFKLDLTNDITIIEETVTINGEVLINFDRRSNNQNIEGDFSEVELERIKTHDITTVSLVSLVNKEKIILKNENMTNHLTSIYEFFNNNVMFDSFMGVAAGNIIAEDKNVKDKILKFLKDCNISIDDITIKDDSQNRKRRRMALLDKKLSDEEIDENEYNRKLKDIAKIKNYVFDKVIKNGKELYYSTESDGTKNLIEILTYIYSAENAVIFFDELESSFHELLCIKLIRLISEFDNIQLIFTSHLIELMDNRWFKKSEIFTVYKRDDISEIIQLSEYAILRSDDKHSWKNWYRLNKISGYPKFED